MLKTLHRDRYFELVRDQLYHEDDVINHRLSWLITGQAIFFGFFIHFVDTSRSRALSPEALVLARVAFFTGILVYISILAAVSNLLLLRKELNHFYDFQEDGRMRPIPNVTTGLGPAIVRGTGLLAPIVVPAIFLAAWLLIVSPLSLLSIFF